MRVRLVWILVLISEEVGTHVSLMSGLRLTSNQKSLVWPDFDQFWTKMSYIWQWQCLIFDIGKRVCQESSIIPAHWLGKKFLDFRLNFFKADGPKTFPWSTCPLSPPLVTSVSGKKFCREILSKQFQEKCERRKAGTVLYTTKPKETTNRWADWEPWICLDNELAGVGSLGGKGGNVL